MSYINKEAAIDLIESMIADKGVAFNPHKLAMALKDMESVEIPEAKDTDLISRQAAIESLKKWFAKEYNDMPDEFDDIARMLMNALPPVEPKPVCEDAISRADTIEAMCSKCVIKEECIGECSDVVVIKNMPPVQPERPKGEWIDMQGNQLKIGGYSGYCSACHEWSEYLTEYCGKCNACMVKENE